MKPALPGCRPHEVAGRIERPGAGFALAAVALGAAIDPVCRHRAQITLAERPATAGADRKTTGHPLIDQNEPHGTCSSFDEGKLWRRPQDVALGDVKGR